VRDNKTQGHRLESKFDGLQRQPSVHAGMPRRCTPPHHLTIEKLFQRSTRVAPPETLHQDP